MEKEYFILLFGVALLFGMISVAGGATAASPTINISVNDSSNGQDSESIAIDVATAEDPVADWVSGADTTADQFRAFDANADGELTDTEVRGAVADYIQNNLNIDLSDREVRTIVAEYVRFG